MKNSYKIVLGTLIAANLIGCAKKEAPFVDPLITNRDTTVSPSEDFFHYANGGWFKQHPIPSSERSNGIFRMIQDTINNQIKSICDLFSTGILLLLSALHFSFLFLHIVSYSVIHSIQ